MTLEASDFTILLCTFILFYTHTFLVFYLNIPPTFIIKSFNIGKNYFIKNLKQNYKTSLIASTTYVT